MKHFVGIVLTGVTSVSVQIVPAKAAPSGAPHV